MSATLSPRAPTTRGVARTQVSRTLAALAFLLLFPAFFFYQTFVEKGYIAPMLGGYFTAGATLVLPLLWLAYLKVPRWQRLGRSLPARLFLAFMLIFGLHIVIGISSGANAEITSTHAAYFLKFIALFLVALLVDGQSKNFQRIAQLLLLGIILMVLGTASDGKFLQGALFATLTGEFSLDYQGLAYCYIVITIYAAPSLNYLLRLGLYVASVVVLFLIGARSEFAGFLLLILVIEFCKASSRPRFLATVLVFCLIALLAYFELASSFADHRVFGLLQLSSDQSALERQDLHNMAMKTISENLLLGRYASYEPGHYAHNIMSAWVDFGLLGFLVFAALFIALTLKTLQKFRAWSRNDLYVQTLGSIALTVLLLLLAKHYTYQMVPIAVGLYCRFHGRQQHLRSLLKSPPPRADITAPQALS